MAVLDRFYCTKQEFLERQMIILQKPADLDLHCFQEKPADQDPYCLEELIYIWFHTVFERIICLSTKRYEAIFFLLDK